MLLFSDSVHLMENVTLTRKQQARLQVLNSLIAGHMTIEQTATLMRLSARHTRRILAAYGKDGAAALAHGNRGRRPEEPGSASRGEPLGTYDTDHEAVGDAIGRFGRGPYLTRQVGVSPVLPLSYIRPG